MTQCLLIDDDLDDQEIFSIAINAVDPTIGCFFADNESDAITKLAQSNFFVPNYIFIDLNMPRMSGVDCLRQIKKLPHLSRSMTVLYSTSIDGKLQTDSVLLGADRFLIKPASLNGLTIELTEIFKSESHQNEIKKKSVHE